LVLFNSGALWRSIKVSHLWPLRILQKFSVLHQPCLC
jgi:hypothetical protein